MRGRPEPGEAAPYYAKYTDLVPGDDVISVLETQLAEMSSLLNGISSDDSLRRYAPGKWSIREVVKHVSDTERVFQYRALWIGRGGEGPLPRQDQDTANRAARADENSWPELVDEFRSVRLATLSLFRTMPADAWLRRGTVSENPVTVRALAYIAAGHAAHHVAVVRERYL
jgi:hypothetical protein